MQEGELRLHANGLFCYAFNNYAMLVETAQEQNACIAIAVVFLTPRLPAPHHLLKGVCVFWGTLLNPKECAL